MRSRRQFIQLVLPALAAARGLPARATPEVQHRVYLPIAQALGAESSQLPNGDRPIVGAPSGTQAQAVAWLAARSAPGGYASYDVASIVARYRDLGEWAGIDWFLALAQLVHETGSMTSWWAQRPRRNPAGIGVTGRMQARPPYTGSWVWNEGVQLWCEGVSFPTWNDHAIPAHLGRLLAYALPDSSANAAQRQLIDYALLIRPLAAENRGCAPTVAGLNGRWAVPGNGYGQRIIDLARRMRG